MVNYLYRLEDIEKNHEAYANQGEIAASSAVKKLLKTEGRRLLDMRLCFSGARNSLPLDWNEVAMARWRHTSPADRSLRADRRHRRVARPGLARRRGDECRD